MRGTIGLLGWLIFLLITCVAVPALAGGGGGGGGVKAVSVPALTPMALAVVQGVIIVGYVVRRRFGK